jgi:hypothetical protein
MTRRLDPRQGDCTAKCPPMIQSGINGIGEMPKKILR